MGDVPWPVEGLVADLRRLGVRPGDHLMVHASLRAIGPVEGGPDGVLDALDRAVGPEGTLMMVLSAGDVPEWTEPPARPDLADADGRAIPFDAATSRAEPEVGWLAEVFRCRPGTQVTAHPLGRFGARGARAARLLEHPPWDHYYGPGSPLDRLCQLGGRVLRLGADPNTVTLLHYSEYLAPIDHKRTVRRYVAVREGEGVAVRRVDSLDDAEGIVVWRGEDYFGLILHAYLDAGRGARGTVGAATSELLDARDLLDFGVRWMAENLNPA